MKTLLVLLLAGTATPALAQQHAQPAPAAPPPATSCTAEHAKMGHCTLPAQAAPPGPVSPTGQEKPAGQTPAPAAATGCTPEHAAMGHCTLPAQAAPPGPVSPTGQEKPAGQAPAPAAATGCTPEHAAMGHCTLPAEADPHAGHGQTDSPPAAAADPHAGHGAAAAAAGPPIGPPPPGALSGPAHAADIAFAPSEMAIARAGMRKEHGGMDASKLLVDQAEIQVADGEDAYKLDGQFWYGGDIDKLWLKTEIEGAVGESPEELEVQALWSRAVDPWFDFQAGLRYDFRPDPERAYLVLGFQGLAPYWFEVEGAAFISHKGDVSARFEAEYDLRLTQKLILQPLVELDLAFQDVPRLGIGAGLSTAEVGARLRYEIDPRFAPYVGIGYERAFGNTADFRRAGDEDVGGWSLLLGLRTWF